MAGASIIGGAPISFLKDGVQTGIPVSLLTFKDGAVDASRLGEPLATDAAPLFALLLASGVIKAGETPAPVVALTLRAKTPGTAGNTLTVKFENVDPKTPAGDSKADVTVHYEDRRKDLTKDSIGAELGITTAGTKPGLIVLKAAATEAPNGMTAAPLNPTTHELDIPGPNGTAFTVQASGTGALFDDVKVAIIGVNAAAGTFTLVISCDRVESGLKVDDIETAFAPLLEIVGTVAAPPAEGQIKLAGGTDPETSSAKAAEASVLSD
jgi:hypothetical protein